MQVQIGKLRENRWKPSGGERQLRGQVCEDSRIIFYSLGFVRANLGKS